MAHPFFDQHRYPWAREDAARLHAVLVQAVANPADIDLRYQQSSGQLPPLNLGQNPRLIWKEALEQLALHRALRRFCELGMEDNMPPVREACTAVMNAATALDAPLAADDVLVLDRAPLRELLTQLAPDHTSAKVLLIRGDPRSGKSHGRHLFARVAREWDAESVYVGDGMVGTVDDVIRKLFSVLKASKEIPERTHPERILPQDTSDIAWYQAVCFKLQELASIQQQPVWIAVDDLGPTSDGAPLLDKEILVFCQEFAKQLADPSFRRWFRLLLIHYPPGRVPTQWRRETWREDRTSEADVKQEHVEALLRSWAAGRGRNLLEDEVRSLASGVIVEADAPAPDAEDDAPRLQRIHDGLAKTLEKLGGTPS
jgi:hypothetical protein